MFDVPFNQSQHPLSLTVSIRTLAEHLHVFLYGNSEIPLNIDSGNFFLAIYTILLLIRLADVHDCAFLCVK